jgi:acid stress chaperone HdeB
MAAVAAPPAEARTMHKFTILAIAAMLSASAPSQAQQLDMSTVKCRDFVSSSKENIALMLMWLQGYYSDQDASPIIDFDQMQKDAAKLGEYCAKNPDHSVITAAEEALDR